MGRRATSRFVVLVALLAFLGASCTTSVGSTAKRSPSTTVRASVPGSTEPSGPTTTAAPRTRSLTEAELIGLLPDADEIGSGYRVDDGSGHDDADRDDDDSGHDDSSGSGRGASRSTEPGGEPDAEAWDEAMRDACPDLYAFSSDFSRVLTVAFSRGPISVERSFVDDLGRKVGVELGDGVDLISSDDRREELVGAINRCDPIRVDDDEIDGEASMTLRAGPDDHYGDRGLVMTMSITLFGDLLPRPVDLTGNVRIFQSGGVVAWISTTDGLDPRTLRSIAVDYSLASRLAERLEHDIAKLQGD